MRFLLSLCFLVTTSAALSIMDYYRPYIGVGKEDLLTIEKQKMTTLMNTSVDPCDDFLEYACGGWRDIPKYTDARALYYNQTRMLFEKPGEFYKAEIPVAAKEFYEKCSREIQDGYSLVDNKIDQLKEWIRTEAQKEGFDWVKILANLSRMGVETFIEMSLEITGEEISLQIRIQDQAKFIEFLETSENIWVRMFFGNALPFGRKLAEKFLKVPKNPPTEAAYPDQLGGLVENMDLASYLSIRFGENFTEKVYVANPGLLNELGEFLAVQDPEEVISYLNVQMFLILMEKYGGDINDCALLAEEMFRYQILIAIAEEDFPPELQSDVLDLANRLQEEQLNIFRTTSWFDSHTREEALAKVQAVQKRLTVNTTFANNECITEIYKGFEVTDENYFQLMFSYNINEKLIKCIKNVDVLYLSVGVTQINAAFGIVAGLHVFVFPGVMIPPFYSYEYPSFKKYSGLGMVLGHELMHNFDSENIKKNSKGVAVDWWSPRLSNKLTRQYECAYTHYNKEYNIDGLLTIGENVPDIVGLKIAYDAYKKWREETNTTAEQEMEGFEDLGLNIDQLFFVNFAQSICLMDNGSINNTSPEGDVHSPPAFRVRGAVANSGDFAEAFSCPVGSAMNPRRKCSYFV